MSDAAPLIQLTGEVCVIRGGERRALTRPRQRAVLAVLAASSPYPVSRGAIVDAVWGEAPPARAEGNLQTYVSGLRRALESDPRRPEFLLTVTGGYRLALPRERVDAAAFELAVDAADTAWRRDDVPGCLTWLYAAEREWQGEPLPGVAGPHAVQERERLLLRRFTMRVLRAEAVLTSGRAEQAVVECDELVREYPLDERVVRILVTGLYRSGRVDEALAALTAMRERLRDELDTRPGSDLVRLHEAILAGEGVGEPQEAAWSGDPGPSASVHVATVVPAELPHRPWVFLGRRAELDEFAVLARERGVRALISGDAGIGKTALALEFAHGATKSYPDGQVYVNLRGSEAGACTATAAMEHVLGAFGVRSNDIPVSPGDKQILLRALLVRRHALLLLDDVADISQVLPVLNCDGPGAVLVTSRNRLPGMPGAHEIRLGGLDLASSTELLRAASQGHRDPGRDTEWTSLAESCGHNPRLLRETAVRLADGTMTVSEWTGHRVSLM